MEVLLGVDLAAQEWDEVSVMAKRMEDCKLATNAEDQTISPETVTQRVSNATLAESLKDTL